VGTYLTAGHVVELEDSPVEVQLFVPGSLEPRYVMEVVKVVRHPDYDAALLTVEWLPVEFASPFEVSAWQPVAGEWVMSGGYARAGLLVLHDGYVAGSAMLPGFGPATQSTAWTIGGMSGGPVVDASGRLVGMTVARGSDGTEHFFLRIEALREWLQTA